MADHEVIGIFSTQDEAEKETGYWGAIFGELFGILTDAGLLFVPGVGQVIIAGPIVGILAAQIEVWCWVERVVLPLVV